MKTIQSLKDITTLEVGDLVVFGNLEYRVSTAGVYFLTRYGDNNDRIFKVLHLNKRDFVEKLGIDANCIGDFPEVKSLEALTAVVSALYKEYEKQNELPKTWEEFCGRNPVTPDEYWIETVYSRYCNGRCNRVRDINMDKNVCVSLQEAEAFTALMQLRQLRKAYVKDWEPDWKDNKQYKACIIYHGTDFMLTYFKDSCSRPLSFPTHELAKQFLNNFKDLLEIAKPLL